MSNVVELNLLLRACEPEAFPRPLKFRRDRLKAIESHIRSRDLKARKSVTMAQIAGGQELESGLKLVAWMDVVPPEKR